jgi:hypothetical protein
MSVGCRESFPMSDTDWSINPINPLWANERNKAHHWIVVRLEHAWSKVAMAHRAKSWTGHAFSSWSIAACPFVRFFLPAQERLEALAMYYALRPSVDAMDAVHCHVYARIKGSGLP